MMLCALLGAETAYLSYTLFATRPAAITATATATATVPPTCQNASEAANPVAAENLCTGTESWKLDHPTGPDNAIEAFATPASVNVGGNLQIYVSTTAPRYTLSIYRMGWYQGLGGRLMYTSATLNGIAQPPPQIDPVTHMVSCHDWAHPNVLHVPANWVSGFYIVKLVSSEGFMRYTPFVIRNDSSHAPIIFTASFLTYQAYNLWGGYDLYRGLDSTGNTVPAERAFAVSFDRPYRDHDGLMDFVPYESSLLRWLERQGYNMTYAADVDGDLRGSLMLHHRLVIVAGHDEYWSTRMRQSITVARDRGISLAFFGADDIYWHIRLQSSPLGSDRVVVCYKHGYTDDGTRDSTDPVAATTPGEATVLWRDPPLNHPENSLLGAMYHGGVQNTSPLVLHSDAARFLNGTGLRVGSALPGLVGGEYDRFAYNGKAPPHVLILAASRVTCVAGEYCPAGATDVANATIYTASSGAKVFDAGTFLWGLGLDPGFNAAAAVYVNAGFQQFTANLLSYLLAR
jgi:hypothetical protein